MRYWLIALLACACGVDRDIEDQITIEQGVYGLLISSCDDTDCPAAGEQVTVYAPSETSAHAKATSNDEGIYQIDLEVGDYTLCIASCTALTITDHGKIRYDWTSGPGGGRWSN